MHDLLARLALKPSEANIGIGLLLAIVPFCAEAHDLAGNFLVGGNASQISQTERGKTRSSFGYLGSVVGLGVVDHLTPIFSIETDFLLSQRRFGFNSDKVVIRVLQVPALGVLSINEFRAVGGLGLSYWAFSGELEHDGTTSKVSASNLGYKSTEINLVLGAGGGRQLAGMVLRGEIRRIQSIGNLAITSGVKAGLVEYQMLLGAEYPAPSGR